MIIKKQNKQKTKSHCSPMKDVRQLLTLKTTKKEKELSFHSLSCENSISK